MKSNNSLLLRTGVFFFVVLMIGLSGYLWWRDGVAPVNPQDTSSIPFTVEKGEGVRTITTRLAREGLIRSPVAFFILVKLKNYDTLLQAGDFRLNRSMSATEIADELTHGVMDTWITIVEGWRSEEVAAKVAKELSIPETEFLKVSDEGYMFPDTYAIPKDATAGAVAGIFRNNFDRQVTVKMRDDLKKQKLSLKDAIILASIVEKEGNSDEDRPVIAGILLNRLRIGMPLQVDATLQYSLGYQSAEKTWWKKVLTEEDKRVNSPYNTYLHAGLPPGPISNPGLSAIKAVIYPKQTDYLYYLHDANGKAHFARTVEEHNGNIRKFL